MVRLLQIYAEQNSPLPELTSSVTGHKNAGARCGGNRDATISRAAVSDGGAAAAGATDAVAASIVRRKKRLRLRFRWWEQAGDLPE